MECPIEKNDHLRQVLLFAFNQDSKVATDARDICIVYSVYVNDERTTQKWYSRFKDGNFALLLYNF